MLQGTDENELIIFKWHYVILTISPKMAEGTVDCYDIEQRLVSLMYFIEHIRTLLSESLIYE